MREVRFFKEGTIPEWTTPEWYAQRESAPHLEQGVHRPRLEMAADLAMRVARSWGWWAVSDLGAGDGGLLQLLKREPRLTAWGYDLQQSNVDASKLRGVDVRYADVLRDRVNYGDIVIATEMIEHLVDPHGFVGSLYDNEDEVQCLIASSPHTDTLEDHIQYHAWGWDVEGYANMLESAGWEVVDHQTTGIFQVAVCVR